MQFTSVTDRQKDRCPDDGKDARSILLSRVKTLQAEIAKFSPSAAWKTLVSGTVKLFDKFEGGHPERGP